MLLFGMLKAKAVCQRKRNDKTGSAQESLTLSTSNPQKVVAE